MDRVRVRIGYESVMNRLGAGTTAEGHVSTVSEAPRVRRDITRPYLAWRKLNVKSDQQLRALDIRGTLHTPQRPTAPPDNSPLFADPNRPGTFWPKRIGPVAARVAENRKKGNRYLPVPNTQTKKASHLYDKAIYRPRRKNEHSTKQVVDAT